MFRRDVIERQQFTLYDEQGVQYGRRAFYRHTYVMATRHFLYTGHPAYLIMSCDGFSPQSLGVLGAIPQQLCALWRIHQVLRHTHRYEKGTKKEAIKIDH